MLETVICTPIVQNAWRFDNSFYCWLNLQAKAEKPLLEAKCMVQCALDRVTTRMRTMQLHNVQRYYVCQVSQLLVHCVQAKLKGLVARSC